MRCYNIEDQNKYFFNLSRAVELEDADENFITEDELKEMGISSYYSGLTMFETKIKREIRKWVKKIPPGGSVTCTDDELIEVLKQYFAQSGGGVADMLNQDRGQVGGVIRSGNKFKLRAEIKNAKKAKRTYRKSDWYKLMQLARSVLKEIGLSTDGIDVPDPFLTLTSIKKIVSWSKMEEANKRGWYDSYYYKKHATKEEMAMVKTMWQKPDLVNKFKWDQ